jgi:nuclear pore complex protein Nup205
MFAEFIFIISQARNPTYREEVKKAPTEGLPIAGQQGKQILSQGFVDESFIISDLFGLNEFAAVELLIAGKNHYHSKTFSFKTLRREYQK